MLNIEIRDDLHATLKQLLVDFRRVQVSRFPIIVKSNDHDAMVKFVDSRFPTDTWRRDRVLGMLSVENKRDAKGRDVITLYSRLIKNDRYAEHNDDHHTKSTFDTGKMLSFMRQYIKPYSPEEIIDKLPSSSNDHYMWMHEPQNKFVNLTRAIRPDILADELRYLKTVGVQFRSNEFLQAATEGLELYEESQRRKHANMHPITVFIQPDGSLLTGWGQSENGKVQMGSTTFESLETAPEVIQQKLAMLKLCEPNAFIPELGRMSSDKAYWILVNPNEFNFSNT